MLASGWYWDLVCVVLACGYRVWLARRVYADYLDHEVTVIWIPFVTTVCEIAVSRIQLRSQMNVAVSFLYHAVYCSGSGNARLYDLKSGGIIDMAANRRRVTTCCGRC